MSTGITAQGGTDRLSLILKLYHLTSAEIVSVVGGGLTALILANRHLSNFVNSFLCRRIKFSHKNPQLFHKVAAVTVRTELSGEPRLASAARYLFSS